MSELVGKARSGLSERVGAVKTLITKEVDLGKAVVKDIVERVNLDQNVEPQLGKTASGGALGQRGNLLKTGIAFASGTMDNVTEFVQKNAQLNRRMLGR